MHEALNPRKALSMRHLLFSSCVFALLGTAANASDTRQTANADYITAYAGLFNVLGRGETPLQFGAEYRFSEWDYGIRPTLGASVDVDGGVYGYGGINWEVSLGQQFYLIPNFMVGAYHDGGSRDLGGTLEFRSGIELAYELSNAHRVGIAFNHISNASIYDKNPGAESLLINYSVPISNIMAR
jgi:lipid A 3-O-deacylase